MAMTNLSTTLQKFCLELLILPHSSAEVERLSSTMNIIKTKLRNKLQLPMFSAILSIKAGLNRCGKCYHSYNIPENVLEIIKTKEIYESVILDDEDVFDLFD
nr:unnamed protein product [Callosobruchus analis]